MPAEEVKSESAKKNEDWMNSKWRPAMGWMYMLVCTTDFVLFPVLWSLVQVVGGGEVRTQWSPITLQGAGLFHMAMGAILGIAAYGRTQEKMAGANNGGIAPPATSFGAPAAPAPAFGGATLGGNTMSTAPSFGARPATNTPTSAFGAPVQPPHPEI
jgi:hypothetical protein